MLFEEIYEYAGQFGKYQICLLIEIMVVAFFAGDAFAILFINNKQDHWCNVPELNNLRLFTIGGGARGVKGRGEKRGKTPSPSCS